MNITRIALSVSAAWVALAVLSGLMLQAELIAPGVRVFLMDGLPAPYLYTGMIRVHTNAVLLALPATLLGGVGCAQLARRHMPGEPLGAALDVCGLSMVLLGTGVAATQVLAPIEPLSRSAQLDWISMAMAGISGFVAVLACLRDARSRRASGPWLVFALVLGGLAVWAGLLQSRGGAADTYLQTAFWHGVGGMAALLALGLLTVVARAHHKRLDARISAILAGLIALLWSIMVIQQVRLGLLGVPRGYLDYPGEFSLFQARASLAVFLAAGFGLLAVLRLAVAPRQPEVEPIASVF